MNNQNFSQIPGMYPQTMYPQYTAGMYGQTYSPYYTSPLPNQAQTPPKQVSIPGRIVNNLGEIAPNEVPMDGSVSVFPTNDYSKIFIKAWQSDGTIKTIAYAPIVSDETQKPEDPTAAILERLDRIEKMVSQNSYKKPYYNKADRAKSATQEGGNP